MPISIRKIYVLASVLLALAFWSGKTMFGRIFYLLSKMGL